MRTVFFIFALLASVAAGATVTVTPLSADYDAQKVTFSVSWTGSAVNNRTWVWIDLCPVAGVSAGTYAPVVISAAAAVAGSIDSIPGNRRGFFVTTNPSTVTATLGTAAGKFNWCVHGSDFPPNAQDAGAGSYTLKGTPPFIITTSSGTVQETSHAYSGGEITAITDATGYPGALCGRNGESASPLNCCVTGVINCDGTCKSSGTYTTPGKGCNGTCNTRMWFLRDQCGAVLDSNYAVADLNCRRGCASGDCGAAREQCAETEGHFAMMLPDGMACLCSDKPCVNITNFFRKAYRWENGWWVPWYEERYDSECRSLGNQQCQ
jgi:hypothetical protein